MLPLVYLCLKQGEKDLRRVLRLPGSCRPGLQRAAELLQHCQRALRLCLAVTVLAEFCIQGIRQQPDQGKLFVKRRISASPERIFGIW